MHNWDLERLKAEAAVRKKQNSGGDDDDDGMRGNAYEGMRT